MKTNERQRDKRRLCEAEKIVIDFDDRGDPMLVLNSEPGVGVTRVVMMAWEREYMEALVEALHVTREDCVVEIGFGLGYSARAIASKNPRRHVVLEPAPVPLKLAGGYEARRETWQGYFFSCDSNESFDVAFFDDFPLNDGEIATNGSRWPDFLRASSSKLNDGARITGYLADPEALSHLPPGFRVESLSSYTEAKPPPDCPYQTSSCCHLFVPIIRFTRKRRS